MSPSSNAALDEQLVPRKLPSAHEFEKMTALRENLSNYVVSLHQKHPNLQKSAYEVLGQISSLESVPFIPVELPNPGSLTPQRMNELENLMIQLRNVWQIVEEADFPWRGYRGNNYDLEVRSELSTVLDDLISKVDSLRLESDKIAKELGLNAPATFDQVKWLIEITKLLMESPQPEASWVTHPNLGQLISEAKTYQTTSDWCKTTRTRLLERYNPSIFSLPLNTSEELKKALSTANESILHSNPEESELLKKREKLLEFAKETQTSSEKWNENSRQLAQTLGLSAENLTLDRVRQLSRIALFCFSEDKPEPRWLDPAYLQQVKETVAKSKKDYQEHNSLRTRLEETYDSDKLVALDLDELARRYGEWIQEFPSDATPQLLSRPKTNRSSHS